MKNNQPDIIEVKDDATDKQIELLQKINPDSLIFKESDEKLKEMYNSLNFKWLKINHKGGVNE